MSERSVTDLFESVPFVPNEDFIAALRGRLQAEFAAQAGAPDFLRMPTGPHEELRAAEPDVDVVHGADRRAGRERPRLRWLLVAAAVIVVAIIVMRSGSSPRHPAITNTPPPTTAEEHAYVQEVSGAVDIGGGQLQFSGTIQLDDATVDTTNPADVVIRPVVDLALTNSGGASVTLTRTYMELYFDTGKVDCVVSQGACATGAVVTPALADPSSTVTAKHPLAVGTHASVPLTIHAAVSGADVVRAASTGDLVAGIAVVVVDGTGAVVSRVFDRTGTLRVSCSALPDNCMNSTRSVLPSSAAPTTVVAGTGPQRLPLGLVPPGTYAFQDFIVPFAITTEQTWSGNGSYGSALWVQLTRTVPFPAMLTFVRAPSSTTSLEDVFASCASDSADATPPVASMLLGVAALQVDAVAHGECWTRDIGLGHDGDTVRIVAAKIGGQIILAVASAPTSDWPVYEPEIAQTIASATPLR